MLPINLEVSTFDDGLQHYRDFPSHEFVSVDFVGEFSEECK
jgi:hypothetical protein